MGRTDPTGQLDLLGYCIALDPLDPNRLPTVRVSAYDRCERNPRSVARFVGEKRWWVPTAVLTLALTLEAFVYSKDSVDEAFGQFIAEVRLELLGVAEQVSGQKS